MKALIAQRFSRVAGHYDAVTPVQQQSAEALFGLLQSSFAAEPVLLDVGVGSGRLLALARKYLGANWQFCGIDFAPQMLAKARLRFPESHLYCCDAEFYDYFPSSYDLIISNFALQWCEQPARLLQRLYTALRPGGQLLAALPLRGSLSHLAQLVEQLSGEQLPLFPLPVRQDFSTLVEQLPGVIITEQNFSIRYQNAYMAITAIKQAGAQTANHQLSFRALRLLRQHPDPSVLNYKVLFISAKNI